MTIQSEQRPTVLESRLILWAMLLVIFAAWAAIWIWLGPAVLFTLAALIIVAGVAFGLVMAWLASVVA